MVAVCVFGAAAVPTVFQNGISVSNGVTLKSGAFVGPMGASNLNGALPAISGAALTGLPATGITNGQAGPMFEAGSAPLVLTNAVFGLHANVSVGSDPGGSGNAAINLGTVTTVGTVRANTVVGSSGFFGDGSGLTNLTAGNAYLSNNQTFSGNNAFTPGSNYFAGTLYVAGAMRTADGSLVATNMTARTNASGGTALTVVGNMEVTGSMTGNGSGITNVQPASVNLTNWSAIATNLIPASQLSGALPSAYGELSPSRLPIAPVVWLNVADSAAAIGNSVNTCGAFTNAGASAPIMVTNLTMGRVLGFTNSMLASTSKIYATNALVVMSLVKPTSYANVCDYTISGNNTFAGTAWFSQRTDGGLSVVAGNPPFALVTTPPVGYLNWAVVTEVWDGSQLYVRVNGVKGAAVSCVGMTIDAYGVMTVGAQAGNIFNGEMAEIAAWTNSLDSATISALELGMLRRHNLWPRQQLLFVGDSIMSAVHIQTNLHTLTLNALNPYTFVPSIKSALGRALVDMLHPEVSTAIHPETRPIVVVEGGVNDLIGGATGAQLYQRFTNACTYYRSYGAKVVYITPTPVTPTIGPADYETQRQAGLLLITNNWQTWCNAIADCGSNPTIGVPANADTNQTTAYYYDGIHPTAAGYQILSTNVIAAMRSFGL